MTMLTDVHAKINRVGCYLTVENYLDKAIMGYVTPDGILIPRSKPVVGRGVIWYPKPAKVLCIASRELRKVWR